MPSTTQLVSSVVLVAVLALSVHIARERTTWLSPPPPDAHSNTNPTLSNSNTDRPTMSSSPTTKFNAVVFGGTGAVGRVLTHQLVANPNTEHVLAVVRRQINDTQDMWGIDKSNTKLQQLVVDYEKDLPDPSTVLNGIKYQAAFSALGTTRKTAGSAAAFRHIDYGYAIKGAEWSKKAGIDQFLYVSSKGANKGSFLLYVQVKGQIEHDLHQRPESTLPVVTVAQPGWLLGHRVEHRGFELMAQSVCKAVYPSIIIEVRAVANGLIQQAMKNLQSPSNAKPYTVLSHDQMKHIGIPTDPQLAWEPQPPARK